MTDTGAAKRYARALFSAAQKQNAIQAVSDDLGGITASLSGASGAKEFLRSPVIDNDKKVALFEKTYGGRISPLTMDLLRLLVKKNRDAEIFHIQASFDELKREHEGVTKAIIESTEPLDDRQRQDLVAKVEQATGKKVIAEYRLNPDLIGGVRVTYDNNVLDGTALGQLKRLREKLLYDLLKQV